MPANKHLIVMAAGTGGHIMPGLAVAREMQQRGWTVSWLGTTHGMENRLVPPSGLAMDTITFSGLRGKGVLHTLTGGLRLLGAFWSCLRIMLKRKPRAVLGMGGYVCFPGGMMAALLGKPLVLMNADAALLLSNKALLPVADRVTFGFSGGPADSTKGAVVTGNPVRREIAELREPAERFATRTGPLRLLVVGGSLGAKMLNETLVQALKLIPESERPLVTHQTGTSHEGSVRADYEAAGVRAEVRAFIDDMAAELARCDLVVCRAGAVTISELCAAGVASVLVPLVVSTTSHQKNNAEWMARHGAAIHLPQSDLDAESLARLVGSLDRVKLLAIAEQARKLAQPNAAARVADEIEGLVR
jgi:UDP-N-acetylglucosamine--N-acetylmuramyl-(pentapeptide) pyrophosphoryl-undecaprenol N-acetylglucosamine transferase